MFSMEIDSMFYKDERIKISESDFLEGYFPFDP